MADHQHHNFHHPLPYPLPSDLDTRNPDFPRQCLLWAGETQWELKELIAASRHAIDRTRELMAEVDRLLAQR